MGDVTQVVTDEQLAKVAREFLMKWEEISPSLGLTQQQEESIRRTYRDYEDQKREALYMWKRNKGNEATFDAFITAAEGISNMELADTLRGFMKTIPGMHASINMCTRLYSIVNKCNKMNRDNIGTKNSFVGTLMYIVCFLQ